MKYKIAKIAGIVAMLLLVCVQSAMILWNYGRTGLGIYDPFNDLGEFSWSTIVDTDWLGVSLCTLWFFLLAIPWIQSFVAMDRQQSLQTTVLNNLDSLHRVLFLQIKVLSTFVLESTIQEKV